MGVAMKRATYLAELAKMAAVDESAMDEAVRVALQRAVGAEADGHDGIEVLTTFAEALLESLGVEVSDERIDTLPPAR